MLIKSIFMKTQSQLLIQILKEDFTHIVTLFDNNSILFRKLIQIGESRTKHRVRTHKSETTLFIEFLQTSLYRCNIRNDTVVREMWQHLFKGRKSVSYRHSIDDKLRTEHLYLLHFSKAVAVICETQTLGILLENCHLVIEAEQVDEETSHLSCSHD